MDQPVNLSWTFWVLILIGNGAIMTLVTLFQQRLFQKQNLESDKEKHKQILELEEKKRADYLVCKNYDELFEMAKILNQILMNWWLSASRAEDQKKKPVTDLWSWKCPIYDRSKTEEISFAMFINQYDYLVSSELLDKIMEAAGEYTNNNLKRTKELVIEAGILLNNLVGVKKSQEEIRKRFERITK